MKTIQNDTEIDAEIQRHSKNSFKLEKSNIFTNKNTISIVMLTNLQHDFKSPDEKEINTKFPENKAIIAAKQHALNECEAVKDYNRYLVYGYPVKYSNENKKLVDVRATLEAIFNKCKELKIKRLAFTKSNLLSNDYNWEQLTDLLNELLKTEKIKVSVHDFEPIQRTNRSVRSTRNSNKSLLLTMLCLIYKIGFCFAETNIHDQFRYCTSSINSQIVINSNNCSTDFRDTPLIEKNVTILDDMPYQIYGYGYACKRTIHIHMVWFKKQID